jgi:hypothetical protein
MKCPITLRALVMGRWPRPDPHGFFGSARLWIRLAQECL